MKIFSRNVRFVAVLGITILFIIVCIYYSDENMENNILSFFPNVFNDASRIKFAHRVNNLQFLQSTLQSDCQFLEADVMLLDTKLGPKLMMAHPPETNSDLSLEKLLYMYKDATRAKPIGLKLDFKQINAVESGLLLLLSYELKHLPLIINADILKSEKDKCQQCDVRDPELFLHYFFVYNPSCWILSVGWSTENSIDGYTWRDVIRMHEVIQKYQEKHGGHSYNLNVTFPVKESKLHWESFNKLLWLVEIYRGSLTIFSSLSNSRTEDTKLCIQNLMNLLGPEQLFFDLGNYDDNELDSMRKSRDNNPSVDSLNVIEPLLWSIGTQDSSSILLNRGGIVFSDTETNATYQRGLKFNDNSQIIINMVVQFIHLHQEELPSGILKIFLHPYLEEKKFWFQIDTANSKPIIGTNPDFEHIYVINIIYNLNKESTILFSPAKATPNGFQILDQHQKRIFKTFEFYPDMSHYFSVIAVCPDHKEKIIVERVVI